MVLSILKHQSVHCGNCLSYLKLVLLPRSFNSSCYLNAVDPMVKIWLSLCEN